MNTTIQYDHYYNYAEMTAVLQDFAAKYPEYLQLTSLLHTAEGRESWLVEITNTATGDFSKKPAYCAIGPVHCQEVIGVMAVLHFIDYIFANRENPDVQDLLDHYTICLLPMPTPDGTDRVLNTAEIPRSVPRQINKDLQPRGIIKKDMDGDGVARVMRFKDPYGPWKISEEDPRVMILKKPDELEGEFYTVLNEGEFETDDWKDHIYNGPERYGYNLNRNWPLGWIPAVGQKGAGEYPLQAEENKAIADFMCSHKNLCFILSYHSSGGVFFYPPANKAPGAIDRTDLKALKAFVNIGTEETGYASRNLYEAFAVQGIPIAGAWDDYLYLARGILGHAIECWNWEERAGIDPKWDRPIANSNPKYAHDNELKFLRWVDENCGTDVFKPWTKFQHPQLGEVEIGGYNQVFVNNPPIPFMKQELEKTTRFMARQVKLLPRLSIANAKAEKLESGVYAVSATIENHGYLSTYVSQEAIKQSLVLPVMASLSGAAEYVSCDAVQNIGQLEGTSAIEADLRDTNYIMAPHKPCRKDVKWVVRASAGTTVTIGAASQRGGCCSEKITLL